MLASTKVAILRFLASVYRDFLSRFGYFNQLWMVRFLLTIVAAHVLLNQDPELPFRVFMEKLMPAFQNSVRSHVLERKFLNRLHIPLGGSHLTLGECHHLGWITFALDRWIKMKLLLNIDQSCQLGRPKRWNKRFKVNRTLVSIWFFIHELLIHIYDGVHWLWIWWSFLSAPSRRNFLSESTQSTTLHFKNFWNKVE